MEKYKDPIFIGLISVAFAFLLIREISWEKKFEITQQLQTSEIKLKDDSVAYLNKQVDSLNWEISSKDIDLGRYEFILGELEQEPCCKKKLETLHPE